VPRGGAYLRRCFKRLRGNGLSPSLARRALPPVRRGLGIIYTRLNEGTGSERSIMPALNIHTLVSMPFEENTYVVWLPGRRDVLVVDPGLEPDLILDFLREQDLTPAAILNT